MLRWLLFFGFCSSLASCDGKPSVPTLVVSGASASGVELSVVEFEGACDASGAVPIDDRHFAVADDEDSVLRIYDAVAGGPPTLRLDVGDAIELEKKGKGKGKGKKKKKQSKARSKNAESDIEAAARIGDTAFFLTSHARTKTGKLDPNRFRFFATEVPSPTESGRTPHLVGEASRRLLDDMLLNEDIAALGLRDAARLPAKAEGSLNLEGMTATFDDKLFIGFRSPQPQGKGLVVTLRNPLGVVDGERASFEKPHLLPLDGLGVRALSSWHGRYLLIAGATAGDRPSALYVWNGEDGVRRVPGLDLRDFNPESFFTPEQGDEMLLLSDDGARVLHGEDCKRLKNSDEKRFRGLRIRRDQLEAQFLEMGEKRADEELPLSERKVQDAGP